MRTRMRHKATGKVRKKITKGIFCLSFCAVLLAHLRHTSKEYAFKHYRFANLISSKAFECPAKFGRIANILDSMIPKQVV